MSKLGVPTTTEVVAVTLPLSKTKIRLVKSLKSVTAKKKKKTNNNAATVFPVLRSAKDAGKENCNTGP
jgi:hypothetical protein